MTTSAIGGSSRETYEYIDVAGDRVYAVHHRAVNGSRGAVLIAGPIGVERERAYRTLVLMARSLAESGFDVLRFDYRGIGESTGDFEKLCMSDWVVDLKSCAQHLRSHTPGVPLVLLGVRTGALMVSRAFAAGLGEGMMLLATPKSGREQLFDILRRSIMGDMLLANHSLPPRTREDIAEQLERGESVNVDGYPWSSALWQDALSHELNLPVGGEKRPWLVVDFKGLPATPMPPGAVHHQTRIAAERFWEVLPVLTAHTPALFATTLSLLNKLVEGRAA